MKQTVEQAAIEYDNSHVCGDNCLMAAFKAGAEWQRNQSPWVRIEERTPPVDEVVLILFEHGEIFNGKYDGNDWMRMDGFKTDGYYSSFSSVCSGYVPVAWMPIPLLPSKKGGQDGNE